MTPAELRPLMLSIAYRMVGSYSEAEDLVQDAYERFHREDHVAAPKAWLTTVVTRLCIDHLRSARVRREEYPGTWLPEPVLADPAPDAALRAESLSMAVLVLLESLTPVERAVFVLREAFDYSYDEIAEIVGKSEDNCRQLALRARRHVTEHKPRFEASRRKREELAARFFSAVGGGNMDDLVSMLAADVVVYGDSGGISPSWPRPIAGRDRVVRLMSGLSGQIRQLGITARRVEINGQPGAMFLDPAGRLTNVFVLDIADGQIQTVRSVINPGKLHHLGPLADMAGLRRQLHQRD